MEERIRFIEHEGKRVLLLVFSHATAEQMISLLDEVRATVAQNEPKSVLVLADYEGAEIDHNVAMKIKEVLTLDRPFVKKAAWIGAEHIPHALMENFHFFSQRETVTFKTRQEALDWLVKE
jgi:pyruvate kinase